MTIRDMLSASLMIDENELVHFADSSPYRYKVYDIAKRNSEDKRTIAHPSKELKFIQRVLIEQLQDVLPIHDRAFAYRKGRGILCNAMEHQHSSYLLKMDFKNFFPSISPKLFFSCCSEYDILFDKLDQRLLKGFLFWKPKRKRSLILSIGAPTSPLISNFIMHRFDEKILDICLEKGVIYTRYADDITFSTNRRGVLFDIPRIVGTLLREIYDGSIKLNNEKTVFSSKAHNRHVTGVTISNDGHLSVGRDRKRQLSVRLHYFSLGLLSEDESCRLQGELAFSFHIEPAFKGRLIRKYGKDIFAELNSLGMENNE